MATYIYARVSTDKQTTDNQIHNLSAEYPDAEIHTETVSGASQNKPVLSKLLKKIQEEDTLVIYSLDRLGRSVIGLVSTIEYLAKRKIRIISKREGAIDTGSPIGRLMVNMMGSIAQLERDIISERIKTALDRLKDKGVKLGRKSKVTEEMRRKAHAMRYEGKSYRHVAKELGICLSQAHKIGDGEDEYSSNT